MHNNIGHIFFNDEHIVSSSDLLISFTNKASYNRLIANLVSSFVGVISFSSFISYDSNPSNYYNYSTFPFNNLINYS